MGVPSDTVAGVDKSVGNVVRVAATIPKSHHRGLLFQIRHNHGLLFSATVLSLVFFTFGYDGGVLSGCLAMPAFVAQFGRPSPSGLILTPTDISIMTALPAAGALLGMPIAAFGGDRFGRRWTMFLAAIIGLVAAVLQTAAFEIAMLTVGRVVANTSIFIFLTLGSGWLAEISPPAVRGNVIGLSIVVIDLAAVITSVVNNATSTNMTSFAYRLPLGLQILFPLIVMLGLVFVKDSPTYFLIKGRNEEALASLESVRHGYSPEEIATEMATLMEQTALLQEANELPWNELFKGTNLRRTLLALSIGNFQQLSGIAFATSYATIFLQQVVGEGQDPFTLVIGLAVLALGGAIVGNVLVDKVGRRLLALGTFIPLLIINIVVGGLGFVDTTTNETASKALAAFCLMFGFFFAAGFGPLTYIIAGEMPTARLRNKTASVAFMVLIIFNIVVVYVLPYIAQPTGANLGAKTYLIFAGWMLMVCVLTYLYLPETRGRSSAELDEMFALRLPARKFRSHVCVLSNDNIIACMSEKAIEAHQIE